MKSVELDEASDAVGASAEMLQIHKRHCDAFRVRHGKVTQQWEEEVHLLPVSHTEPCVERRVILKIHSKVSMFNIVLYQS